MYTVPLPLDTFYTKGDALLSWSQEYFLFDSWDTYISYYPSILAVRVIESYDGIFKQYYSPQL